jgi:hypothetical protein
VLDEFFPVFSFGGNIWGESMAEPDNVLIAEFGTA